MQVTRFTDKQVTHTGNKCRLKKANYLLYENAGKEGRWEMQQKKNAGFEFRVECGLTFYKNAADNTVTKALKRQL